MQNNSQVSNFYEPNTYDLPAPHPLNSRKTLLPWYKAGQYERKMDERERMYQREERKKNKGFMSTIGTQVSKGIHKLGQKTDKLMYKQQRVDRWENETSLRRFRDFFDYPLTEQLWGEYHCYVLHKKGVFPASIFISTNWVSMLYDNMQTRRNVHVKIPIKSIVSIQNALTIQRQGEMPLLQLVTEKRARSDAIQIYTNDSRVHLFYRFYGERSAEFFNVLEKCWRASFMIQPIYVDHLPGMPPQTPYDLTLQNQQMNPQLDPHMNQNVNPQIYPQTNLGSQLNPHMNPQNQNMQSRGLNQQSPVIQHPQMQQHQMHQQYSPSFHRQQSPLQQSPVIQHPQMQQQQCSPCMYHQPIQPQMQQQQYSPSFHHQQIQPQMQHQQYSPSFHHQQMQPQMQHQQYSPSLHRQQFQQGGFQNNNNMVNTSHQVHQNPIQTNPHVLVNPENLYTNQIGSTHDIMEPRSNISTGKIIPQQPAPYYCYESNSLQGRDTGFPKEFNY